MQTFDPRTQLLLGFSTFQVPSSESPASPKVLVHPNANRNLLYTGITRSRRVLDLFGTAESLDLVLNT